MVVNEDDDKLVKLGVNNRERGALITAHKESFFFFLYKFPQVGSGDALIHLMVQCSQQKINMY